MCTQRLVAAGLIGLWVSAGLVVIIAFALGGEQRTPTTLVPSAYVCVSPMIGNKTALVATGPLVPALGNATLADVRIGAWMHNGTSSQLGALCEGADEILVVDAATGIVGALTVAGAYEPRFLLTRDGGKAPFGAVWDTLYFGDASSPPNVVQTSLAGTGAVAAAWAPLWEAAAKAGLVGGIAGARWLQAQQRWLLVARSCGSAAQGAPCALLYDLASGTSTAAALPAGAVRAFAVVGEALTNGDAPAFATTLLLVRPAADGAATLAMALLGSDAAGTSVRVGAACAGAAVLYAHERVQ